MGTLLAIGLGGFIGAICRFVLAKQVDFWMASEFPFGTLTVNALGSFILGFLTRFFGDHMILPDAVRIGITVGFLGALTTFSTFSGQTFLMLENGEFLKMSINVLSNVAICLILCGFGLHLAKLI